MWTILIPLGLMSSGDGGLPIIWDNAFPTLAARPLSFPLPFFCFIFGPPCFAIRHQSTCAIEH